MCGVSPEAIKHIISKHVADWLFDFQTVTKNSERIFKPNKKQPPEEKQRLLVSRDTQQIC